MTDLSGAVWRKASRSAHNGGCVEVAVNLPGLTAIRDSKRPGTGALVIDRAVFAAFVADVRRGAHDISPSEIHDVTLRARVAPAPEESNV